MRYTEILPHKLLRQYIKCYWLLENPYPAGTVEEVLPQSCYELLYQHHISYRLDGEALPKLSMIGPLDQPLHLSAGDTKLWCARFMPWGLPPFGDAEQLVRNQVTDASVVFRASIIESFIARLATATDDTFMHIFDEVFLSALLAWQFDDLTITRIANRIRTKQGNVKVAELADACFKSRRQIERDVLHATGTQPKDMLAKLRFEQAWKMLLRNPDLPLLEVAAVCGYADQAHMTREFRRLAQTTPNQFSKQVKHMGISKDQDVAFVQT